MKAMFFSLFLIYIGISFIILLLLITDKLTFWDKDTNQKFIIRPVTKVALSIYWPVLVYIILKSMKEVRG